MSRIASIFQKKGHTAFIPYLTIGYPTVEATLKAVPLLAENGCDMVELGIPFSDPMADGATIQKASFKALENGVTPKICLETARKLREKVDIPLVFMTYFNPVFAYGLEEFCHDCHEAGIDGLIIPDLPPEEGYGLEVISQLYGLDLIYLLSPTSSQARIKLVAERSRGFIYLVSITGVTGARNSLPEDLEAFIKRVRKTTKKPLCIGFGISTAQQVKDVSRIADGVIVGSRVVQSMETKNDFGPLLELIKELRGSID